MTGVRVPSWRICHHPFEKLGFNQEHTIMAWRELVCIPVDNTNTQFGKMERCVVPFKPHLINSGAAELVTARAVVVFPAFLYATL